MTEDGGQGSRQDMTEDGGQGSRQDMTEDGGQGSRQNVTEFTSGCQPGSKFSHTQLSVHTETQS